MTGRQIWAETVNGVRAVIVQTADGFRGVTFSDGRPAEPVDHEDFDTLRAAMLNAAGKAHPDYFGIDGAQKRFLSFFHSGFADPGYLAQERDYKDRARESLLAAAPVEQALEADAGVAVACRRGLGTNLLSRFESARLSELLGSQDGASFVRAAAAFAVAPEQAALDAMVRAITPHGRPSWAIITYLPYLWAPESQMFLKPEATRDFAVRVGHHFDRDYDPSPELSVYHSLLDLAAWTQAQISELRPADRIDVQSFIWVVGSYTDGDRPVEESGAE